ncbi:DNA polymerase III subunit alpha [Oerskovia flava]|uniref:DNA polymerase III subunit alpha n=1 Tax=Oerskovia flava TaxID=2986422 RepID=UPI0022406738|nr:DNA polymerase III subunit alpha [Oerskovia sp. JB1-3-2]
MGYVSLHTHSEHSELDGLASISDYVQAAIADGQSALAITDHGTLSGAWQLTTQCTDAGIKPIAGEEFYLAFGSNRAKVGEPVDPDDEDSEDVGTKEDGARSAKPDKRYMHLTVLARTPEGWSNLVRLHNNAAENVWYKPRTDLEQLKAHREGLIVLTGCLGGPLAFYLNRAVLRDGRAEHDGAAADRATARANALALIDAVGHENVYVEVMDHGIAAQQRVTGELRALAADLDLPLVATNDAHYAHPGDHTAHEAWLAAGSKKTLADPKRFHFHGTGHHFRTEAEMRALFDGAPWWQEAVDNTVRIAERCAERTLPAPRTRIPHFPVPDGYTDTTALLKDQIAAGALKRYGTGTETSVKDLPEDVRSRLNWEFKVIRGSGFGDYFLIVADVIAWARAQGILVGPGRGSAAGSMVAYCLGITNLCPLRHSLLFERFLDPERAGLPDIDVDFQQSRRGEVHQYFARRWGADKVAALGTFGVARAKDAISRAARALGHPDAGTKKLTKKYPMAGAKPYPMARAVDPTDPATETLRTALERDEDARAAFDLARGMEDTIFGKSIHACGVVLSDEGLDDLVPVRHNSKDAGALRITEWEGSDVEAFGLVKMDFLVLRNLDIADLCVRIIAETTGEVIDVDRIDPDHPDSPERAQATWDLLQSGRTSGLFQLESGGMSQLAEQVAPTSIDDLSALVALFRPGPLGAGMHTRYADRKNGREQVSYDYLTTDPAEQHVIAQVLDETYGTVVFQEQLMILGEKVAGFSAAQKNRLRKAVSKKKADEVAAVGRMWLDGGQQEVRDDDGHVVKIAFSRATLERLWATFESSAEYLFNKSHSAAYGLVTYMTAYLKANWPLQFAAAMLACTDHDDKRRTALVEVSAEGITIGGPGVNVAQARAFTDGSAVYLGLAEIKGVGAQVAEAIVAEREAHGPFTSMGDFVRRTHAPDGKVLGPSTVESLIRAGALDEFGPRLGMMMVARTRGSVDQIPDAEWGVVERSAQERAAIGFVVGAHPLVELRDQIRGWRPEGHSITPVPLHKTPTDHGEVTTTIGVLADWSERSYSRGRMASGRLEGSTQTKEIVAFDQALKQVGSAFEGAPQVGDVVAIRGRVSVREREFTEVDEEGNDVTRTETTTSLNVNHMWSVELDDAAHVATPKARARPALRVVPNREDAAPAPEPAPGAAVVEEQVEAGVEGFADPAPLSTTIVTVDDVEGLAHTPAPEPAESVAAGDGGVTVLSLRWREERDVVWADARASARTTYAAALTASRALQQMSVTMPPSPGTWVTRTGPLVVVVNAWTQRAARDQLEAQPQEDLDGSGLLPGVWVQLTAVRALAAVS